MIIDKINEFKNDANEMDKCLKSMSYFVINHAFNNDLNREQLIILKAIENGQQVEELLPRQYGKTLVATAILAWFFIFGQNFISEIDAPKRTMMLSIRSEVLQIIANLPSNWKHIIGEPSKSNPDTDELELNTNILRFRVKNPDIEPNFRYEDEYVFIKERQLQYTGRPALSLSTSRLLG